MKSPENARGSESAVPLLWRDFGPRLASTGKAPLRDPSASSTRWCRAPAGLTAAGENLLTACGAFEWGALVYLGISGVLIAIFGRNIARAPLHLALHAAVAMLILALSMAARYKSSPAVRFWRHWYPHLFFLFCFEELGALVHLIFPGWFDRWLIALDYWLVGVHPTLWLEQFARPALNDFMQMAYVTYFFYLIILGALLYARKEWRAYWGVMTSSVVAYAIGYVIAIVFPIESPYHTLAALQRVELTGGFFTGLINFIESFGRVHGAAFPSAHVSGSFVALLGAWRYRRWLFWIFLPFFLCMLVSTVYGRYHYIADVLAGLIVGGVGDWLGHRLMRSTKALPVLAQRGRAGNEITSPDVAGASRWPVRKRRQCSTAALPPTSDR